MNKANAKLPVEKVDSQFKLGEMNWYSEDFGSSCEYFDLKRFIFRNCVAKRYLRDDMGLTRVSIMVLGYNFYIAKPLSMYIYIHVSI